MYGRFPAFDHVGHGRGVDGLGDLLKLFSGLGRLDKDHVCAGPGVCICPLDGVIESVNRAGVGAAQGREIPHS